MIRSEKSMISYSEDLSEHCVEFEEAVRDTVAFFKKGYEFSELVTSDKLEIIFSNDFLRERNEIHISPREKGYDPNGEFIPKENQKVTEYKKNIIILNVKKLSVNKLFFKGVIVHELSHYYDIVFLLDKLSSSYENLPVRFSGFVQFFLKYSEMRSKYYQEAYIIKHCKIKISDYVESELNTYEVDRKWYKIAHRWGQILCWEDNKEYINLNKNLLNKIDTVKYSLYQQKRKSILLPLLFNEKTDSGFQEICKKILLLRRYLDIEKCIVDYAGGDKLKNRLGEEIINILGNH
jgi:hypothetical protein